MKEPIVEVSLPSLPGVVFGETAEGDWLIRAGEDAVWSEVDSGPGVAALPALESEPRTSAGPVFSAVMGVVARRALLTKRPYWVNLGLTWIKLNATVDPELVEILLGVSTDPAQTQTDRHTAVSLVPKDGLAD